MMSLRIILNRWLKSRTLIFVIGLVMLLIMRMIYGHNIIPSGDEISIGVVQAVGKWEFMKQTFPTDSIVEMSSYRKYFNPSHEYGGKEVLSIMWRDQLHPPLYFILLHFYIKLFGNSIFLLRMFSAIISLFTVVSGYLLGKEIFNKSVGIWVALLFALSPYLLEYSIMIRMYPLATCLALLSTLYLFRLLKSHKINFQNRYLYFYMLISIAGLYTYYSFSVVLLSHFLMVIVIKWKKYWEIINAIIAYSIVFLIFIPWIMPFIEGLGQVSNKDLYFKGEYPVSLFVKLLFKISVFPYDNVLVWFEFSALTLVVLSGICLILWLIIAGIINAKQNTIFRTFVFSFLFYIGISVINDKIFKTSTFIFDRQHYYSVPVFLIILAGSIGSLNMSKVWQRVIVLCISLVLLTGSVYRFANKSTFDGPGYFMELSKNVDNRTKQYRDNECLLIFSLSDKRYTLPYVYHSKHNYFVLFSQQGVNQQALLRECLNRGFKTVMAVNVELNERKKKRLKLKEFDIKKLNETLTGNAFVFRESPVIYTGEESVTLYVFDRQNVVNP